MDFFRKNNIDDLAQYQIHSRHEIVSLLKNISRKNQLVQMIFKNGEEAIVTSILHVDADSVVIDHAPSQLQNERILASENLTFETMLDRVRILFSAAHIEACLFENRAAYLVALPGSVIRLQRSESYRVQTPGCLVQIPFDSGQGIVNVIASMRDLNTGGLGLVDEQKILDNTLGRIYSDCRILLSDAQTIAVDLQIRNSQEIKLANGKMQRRLGCQFVEIPNAMLLAVQRYITKIEREQNAKATGLV